MSWELQLKRTITITQTFSQRSYGGSTAQEAKDYEEGLEKEGKILAFHDALSFIPDEDIEVSEAVTIIEK